MKSSLSSKRVNFILSNAPTFKTTALSFRYLVSTRPGIAFSLNKNRGHAVLRNKFKRQSRAIMHSSLFGGLSLEVVVHSLSLLTRNSNVYDDFKLFRDHLDSNLNNNKK